jgi:hypothetical protein
MNKIKPLKKKQLINNNGEIYGETNPDIREIVDKVNEILEVINKLIEKQN